MPRAILRSVFSASGRFRSKIDGQGSDQSIISAEVRQGYPNGLAGEDIPLVGRIIAIADVFDALTSKRPYKQAWSVEDAMNHLKSEAGEHFDPHLVALFLDLKPKLLKIKTRYADES